MFAPCEIGLEIYSRNELDGILVEHIVVPSFVV